jgi:glutamine amidotransferase-like uncharacterized protein
MSASTKVFLYNHSSTDELCRNDLKEFLIQGNIFSRLDICESDFSFNPDGLIKGGNPTLVIPGGSAIAMKTGLNETLGQFDPSLLDHCNILGVCAGGFTATSSALLCLTNTPTSLLKHPEYVYTMGKGYTLTNFHVTKDFEAVGPIIPNASFRQRRFSELKDKALLPYKVEINLSGRTKQLSQLYLSGPGFFQTHAHPSCEVAATYADQESYTIDFPGAAPRVYTQLPAIIKRKTSAEHAGIYLSGIHIEATLPGSKLLGFFTPTATQTNMESAEHTALCKTQEDSFTHFIAELKDTFRKT